MGGYSFMRRRGVGLLVIMMVVTVLLGGRAAGQLTASSRLPDGVTPEVDAAIARGLAFLARTQDRDGSWSNRGQFGRYPVAMTGLAGVALLMDGNTTTPRPLCRPSGSCDKVPFAVRHGERPDRAEHERGQAHVRPRLLDAVPQSTARHGRGPRAS